MVIRSQRLGKIMEPQPCFNLNHAIDQWRTALTSRDSVNSAQLHELETHLRDAVALWESRGLTQAESFHIASSRLGAPSAIAAEFEKEDPLGPWRTRFFWMLVGLMSLAFMSRFTNLLVTGFCILTVNRWVPDAGSRYIPIEFLGNGFFETGITDFLDIDIPSVVQIIVSISFPALLYFASKWLTTRTTARNRARASRLALGLALIVLLVGTNLLDTASQVFLRGLLFGDEAFHFNWTPQTLLFSVFYPTALAILAARFAPGVTATSAADR
jgi:hypothetical protein